MSDETNGKRDEWEEPKSGSAANESLRQELLRMQAVDQEMRATITRKYPTGTPISAEDTEWWESVDGANTERMKQIIAEHGWPGMSLVGRDGAFAAWLLIQHADRDREFQRECLAMLQSSAAAGEAEARNLAYLTDRVRVGEKRPQVYGTQMHLVDGEYAPEDIEDADHVDERRAAVGLEPLADYVAQLRTIAEESGKG